MKMKNVAILCLGLIASELCYAQGYENEFRFGIKGGVNVGWIQPTSKNLEGAGAKIGGSYGFMADYFFRPNYALSFELLMSNINGSVRLTEDQIFNKDTSNTSVSNLEYTYKNQFVEIPVSLKFRTKQIGYLTYWANFGTAPGFLIKAQASIEGALPASIDDLDPTDYSTIDDEGDTYTTNNFNDQVFLIRMPLIIGAGVDYQLAGSASLHAGIRFSNSFSDMLFKDKNVGAQQKYVSFSLGVFF